MCFGGKLIHRGKTTNRRGGLCPPCDSSTNHGTQPAHYRPPSSSAKTHHHAIPKRARPGLSSTHTHWRLNQQWSPLLAYWPDLTGAGLTSFPPNRFEPLSQSRCRKQLPQDSVGKCRDPLAETRAEGSDCYSSIGGKPQIFNTPLKVLASEFWNTDLIPEMEWCSYHIVRKDFDAVWIRLDAISQRDGRTDRNPISISRVTMLMRDRNQLISGHLKGSVKEPNKFTTMKLRKITRKASDMAEYIALFGSSTRDRHTWRPPLYSV